MIHVKFTLMIKFLWMKNWDTCSKQDLGCSKHAQVLTTLQPLVGVLQPVFGGYCAKLHSSFYLHNITANTHTLWRFTLRICIYFVPMKLDFGKDFDCRKKRKPLINTLS